MENKIIESTSLRSADNRIIDASIVNIDIPSTIIQIKDEKIWTDSDRNAITVYKTNGLSIVLIALHQNAVMPKHKANGILSLQVIEGAIQFKTDDATIHLKAGQMIALHSAIEHSVLAMEDAVFLLTITTSTKHFTD